MLLVFREEYFQYFVYKPLLIETVPVVTSSSQRLGVNSSHVHPVQEDLVFADAATTACLVMSTIQNRTNAGSSEDRILSLVTLVLVSVGSA